MGDAWVVLVLRNADLGCLDAHLHETRRSLTYDLPRRVFLPWVPSASRGSVFRAVFG